MRIAYSTYALQEVDPFEAVERVKTIGYEGLELNCGADWPTAPERFGEDARKRMVDAYQAAGFPSPVMMNLIHLCAHGENVEEKRSRLKATCRLARDLCSEDGPSVVTTTLGKQPNGWGQDKEMVAEKLRPYAELAADHNVILAAEAHVGQEMDTPEKARWLVEAVGHSNLRLNFDYSHFLLLAIDLQHSLAVKAEYSVHTHIKDGRMTDGKGQFALPGDDQLDLVDYLTRVRASVLDVPITVEVSAQIWKRDDYDPWETATHSFKNLDQARKSLG